MPDLALQHGECNMQDWAGSNRCVSATCQQSQPPARPDTAWDAPMRVQKGVDDTQCHRCQPCKRLIASCTCWTWQPADTRPAPAAVQAAGPAAVQGQGLAHLHHDLAVAGCTVELHSLCSSTCIREHTIVCKLSPTHHRRMCGVCVKVRALLPAMLLDGSPDAKALESFNSAWQALGRPGAA